MCGSLGKPFTWSHFDIVLKNNFLNYVFLLQESQRQVKF